MPCKLKAAVEIGAEFGSTDGKRSELLPTHLKNQSKSLCFFVYLIKYYCVVIYADLVFFS